MSKLILIIIFFLGATAASAQTKYELKETVEGVEYSFKWSKSSFFKKNSPPQLRIKIKNNNEYPVLYSFGIDLFVKGKTKGEVLPEQYPIRAKQTKAGKTNGHYYEFNLSWEEVRSTEFEIEFTDLSVKTMDVIE
jgi:hypothetical protein